MCRCPTIASIMAEVNSFVEKKGKAPLKIRMSPAMATEIISGTWAFTYNNSPYGYNNIQISTPFGIIPAVICPYPIYDPYFDFDEEDEKSIQWLFDEVLSECK